MDKDTFLELVAHFGSQREIAWFCEVSDVSVHDWKKRGQIPVEHVAKFCEEIPEMEPGRLNPFFIGFKYVG